MCPAPLRWGFSVSIATGGRAVAGRGRSTPSPLKRCISYGEQRWSVLYITIAVSFMALLDRVSQVMSDRDFLLYVSRPPATFTKAAAEYANFTVDKCIIVAKSIGAGYCGKSTLFFMPALAAFSVQIWFNEQRIDSHATHRRSWHFFQD